MANRSAEDHAATAAKCRAWSLRIRGWTQERIGHELGVDQGTISRWLAQVEREELARLRESVEAQKAHQSAVLDHILDESLQAWERSKQPRSRVRKAQDGPTKLGEDGRPVGPGPDGQTVTEVTNRDGSVEYLDRALATLAHKRRLWGLDVAEKSQESGPGAFSDVMRRVKSQAARFEARAAEPDPDAEGEGEEGGPGG